LNSNYVNRNHERHAVLLTDFPTGPWGRGDICY